MSILPGTPVKLPNGRDGVVIPSPHLTPGRVLVKVKTGRKRWFKVDECTPVLLPSSINDSRIVR
ncbi:MAG: hypothetical protein IGS48_11735 [Oscillatoriales cyanobacterium C42_A2020_001]|nr:hypothetical protein [Leptolyngbyaceae cyanobacterium C42_A2020_001]